MWVADWAQKCRNKKYDNFHLKLYRRIAGGVGVFPLLFVCEYISNLFFDSVNGIKDGWKERIGQLIGYISKASMACYMFHRLFFWAGEIVWNPSADWLKLMYMASIVFPLMLVLSYYIQKGYDLLINKLNKHNV